MLLKWVKSGQQYYHLQSMITFFTVCPTHIGDPDLIFVFFLFLTGDLLSGVCYVGVLDDSSLLYLLVVPLTIYLAVGFVFLVLGFASLLQVRTIMKRDGTRTDKLERLMLRIGQYNIMPGIFLSTFPDTSDRPKFGFLS